MKAFYTTLLFILAFGSSAQSLKDTLNQYLDTCSNTTDIWYTAQKYARSNVFSDMGDVHLMLSLATDRIFDTQDSTVRGSILQEHGIIHAIRHEHDSAIYYFHAALDQYRTSDSSQIGFTYRNLCASLRTLDQFNPSLEYGYTALRYLSTDDSLLRPLTYLEISKVLYTLQNYELSLEYSKKALPYFKVRGATYDIGSCYNSMGLAALNMDSLAEESTRWLYRSLAINLALQDSISLYESHINIGISYLTQKRYDSALYHFNFVEESNFIEETNRFYIKPILYANKGLALYRLGRTTEGLNYTRTGLNLALELNSTYIVERAAQTLKDIYLSAGDSTEALKYYDIFHRAYESNLALANSSKYQTLEQLVEERLLTQKATYRQKALEKDAERDKELLLYTYIGLGAVMSLLFITFLSYRRAYRRKTELVKINRRLSDLDESKTQLFSIIGHDLRGPIGNSIYLLNEISKTDQTLSAESKEIVQHVEQGMIQVQDLLENLLLWAKDQATDVRLERRLLELLPLAKNIQKILSPLADINQIKTQIQSPSGLKWSIDENAYSTILRNVLSNSYKYAKPGTVVEVNLTISQGELITRICDEGPGISAEVIEKMKSSSHYSSGTSTGMGLYLVNLLTIKHGGHIHYTHDGVRGCMEIHIPEKLEGSKDTSL